MLKRFGASVVVLAGMTLVILASARAAGAAVVSTTVLKSFFQTGDFPTQSQFSSLIDSMVNIVDDRDLVGLKVYDPQLTYLVGDTVIFNRLTIGDRVGELAEGTPTLPPALEFVDWSPLNPNNPSEMDVAADFAGQYGFLGIQLRNSLGQINYGFLQMGMDPVGSALYPAIHVDYLVYESNANTPISVFAVPEPASLTLLGLGWLALVRRRRARSGIGP